MSEEIFSSLFYLLHKNGEKLYPVKMRNRDNGKRLYRVSPGGTGGNTKKAGIEVDDENEMKNYVFKHGYAVRVSSKDKETKGLYKIGHRSIISAVEL